MTLAAQNLQEIVMLVTMMQKIAANRCDNPASCFIYGSIERSEKWFRIVSALRCEQLLHLIEKQDQAIGAGALRDSRLEKLCENAGLRKQALPRIERTNTGSLSL